MGICCNQMKYGTVPMEKGTCQTFPAQCKGENEGGRGVGAQPRGVCCAAGAEQGTAAVRVESCGDQLTLQSSSPCCGLAADSLEEQPFGCSPVPWCCAATRKGRGFARWVSLGACWSSPLTRRALADCSITKFLNRILGLEVDKQNMLFQYFSDTFDYLIEKDKKEGKYDMGILGKEKGVIIPLPAAPCGSLLLPALTTGCCSLRCPHGLAGASVSQPHLAQLLPPLCRQKRLEVGSYMCFGLSSCYRFSPRSG